MALRFAQFTTSAESQALVVKNAHLVSANLLAIARADDAEINSFMSQAQVAAPMPARPEAMILFEKGDRLYERVLEEGMEPAAAVARFVEQVDLAPTPDVVAYAGNAVLACQEGQRLQIWHSLTLGDAESTSEGEVGQDPLAAIAEWFRDYCAGVQVDLRYVAADEMAAKLAQAKADDAAPDAVLTSGELIAPLAQRELIRPIMSLVDDAVLDQYLPKAIQAVAHQETLYGIPQSMHVAALYYNADLVSNPAVTLDDLLAHADPQHQVILDDSFAGAYWGMGAFGAELSPAEATTDQPAGYAEWLHWLQAAHAKSGVVFSADPAEQLALFAAGQAAYLVAGPELLGDLRAAMDGHVRVAPLPAGPKGNAAPLLQVDAFLFPTGRTEAQTQLALSFAEFATSEVNQTRWLQTASLAPTNRSAAELTQNSAIRAFVTQAVETAVVLPSARLFPLRTLGDQIYAQVLDGELSPDAGVNMIFDALREVGDSGSSENAAASDNSDS
ncbi:MAG: extracellular solute-binding protein, partial [Caldilineaceae bacterium]|nr:extracellular solute-binding protein [Caldilineaceae bacterium]